MAAPTPITRQTPAGIHLQEGHGAKITIGADPDVSFWEKTVTPPGMDGGDAIEQTTQFNTLYITKAPQTLIDMTNASGTAAYDPNVYNNIIALINVETTCTVRFPDASTLAFYGFLKSFIPTELVKGQQPEANFEVVCTNYDYANKVEAAPVLTSVAGT